MEKDKIKKYGTYIAGFLGGVAFFITVPVIVIYLFAVLSGEVEISFIPPLIVILVIYATALFILWKKNKTVFRTVLFGFLSLFGAFIVTLITTRVPLDGFRLKFYSGGCGDPSGLPFSFIGTFHNPKFGPFTNPLCPPGFDVVALIADIIIWFIVLILIVKLLSGILKKLQKK